MWGGDPSRRRPIGPWAPSRCRTGIPGSPTTCRGPRRLALDGPMAQPIAPLMWGRCRPLPDRVSLDAPTDPILAGVGRLVVSAVELPSLPICQRNPASSYQRRRHSGAVSYTESKSWRVFGRDWHAAPGGTDNHQDPGWRPAGRAVRDSQRRIVHIPPSRKTRYAACSNRASAH